MQQTSVFGPDFQLSYCHIPPGGIWLGHAAASPNPSGIVNRLKRAEGHLSKIIRMIEEERSCLDLAQQLHAVEKAICEAKKTLIHDHIDHCLEQSVGTLSEGSQAAVEEFKQITKYLG